MMNPRHAAALALVGCLMLPTPPLAEPFAVPGTVDSGTWYMLVKPGSPPPLLNDWIKVGPFPTKYACEADADAVIAHSLHKGLTSVCERSGCEPERLERLCASGDDPRLSEKK